MHLWISVLVFSSFNALAASRLDPALAQRVETVCGFCHFSEFLDPQTGHLVEQTLWDRRDSILRRLNATPGDRTIMPPKSSPLQLTAEERKALIQALSLP